MYIYIFKCIYIYIFKCIYIYIFIFVYVYLYMYIYIYYPFHISHQGWKQRLSESKVERFNVAHLMLRHNSSYLEAYCGLTMFSGTQRPYIF